MIHHLTADEVILKATAEVNSIFQHCHMKLKEHLKEAGRNNEELMRQKLAAEGIRGSAIYRINRHNDIWRIYLPGGRQNTVCSYRASVLFSPKMPRLMRCTK